MDFFKKHGLVIMASISLLLVGALATALVSDNKSVKVSYKDTVIEVGHNGDSEEMMVSEAIRYIYETMITMEEQNKVVYRYTTNEMVRFVEKQYTKVTEKPDDFYPTDLVYCFDNIWPYIPDGMKGQALIAKYEYLMNYYKSHMAGGGYSDDGLRFSMAEVSG